MTSAQTSGRSSNDAGAIDGRARARPPEDLLADRPDLLNRFTALRQFAATIRVSEYHVTSACDLRCRGCWFFAHGFDLPTKDETDPALLRAFIAKERARGVNSCLLIGGEPLLFPKRIEAYVEGMEYVSLSSNGLRRLPTQGFERVQVFVTVFGGGALDDELRGVGANGRKLTGLLDRALDNFADDPRATFVFCVAEAGIAHIEETVCRIASNGNRVTFSCYSPYDSPQRLHVNDAQRLIDELLRVKARYPDTVLSTPYYIRTIVTGQTHWGRFGYETCPSISVDHPAHKIRLGNGNRVLPLFNTYAPDLQTMNFCCTSGRCDDCRDSQAVSSWLMVNAHEFMASSELFEQWIELAEAYWGQFVWSPVRPRPATG